MIRIVLPWFYVGIHDLLTGRCHRALLVKMAMPCMKLAAFFRRPLKNFCSPYSSVASRPFRAWRALVAAPARFTAP